MSQQLAVHAQHVGAVAAYLLTCSRRCCCQPAPRICSCSCWQCPWQRRKAWCCTTALANCSNCSCGCGTAYGCRHGATPYSCSLLVFPQPHAQSLNNNGQPTLVGWHKAQHLQLLLSTLHTDCCLLPTTRNKLFEQVQCRVATPPYKVLIPARPRVIHRCFCNEFAWSVCLGSRSMWWCSCILAQDTPRCFSAALRKHPED